MIFGRTQTVYVELDKSLLNTHSLPHTVIVTSPAIRAEVRPGSSEFEIARRQSPPYPHVTSP